MLEGRDSKCYPLKTKWTAVFLHPSSVVGSFLCRSSEIPHKKYWTLRIPIVMGPDHQELPQAFYSASCCFPPVCSDLVKERKTFRNFSLSDCCFLWHDPEKRCSFFLYLNYSAMEQKSPWSPETHTSIGIISAFWKDETAARWSQTWFFSIRAEFGLVIQVKFLLLIPFDESTIRGTVGLKLFGEAYLNKIPVSKFLTALLVVGLRAIGSGHFTPACIILSTFETCPGDL